MSLRDFVTHVSVILTVMAAAALIETVVPMFMAKPWKHPRRTPLSGLLTLPFDSDPKTGLPDRKVRFEAGTGR